MKPKAFFYGLPLVVVVGCCLVAWQQLSPDQSNAPPKVTILKPGTNDKFNWGSVISYSISVEDKEDGLSKYDEIAPNEVFLKIKFLSDSGSAKTYIAKEARLPEPAPLTVIKTSDCFNCHAVKSKVMGPSFESMAKQYANKAGAVAKLAGTIIRGSEKATGTERMPAHPQISMTMAKEIVRWILSNAADPTIDYVRGLQGTFRTKQKAVKNAGNAVYVLTASYRDHGLTETPQQVIEGKHVVMLKSN